MWVECRWDMGFFSQECTFLVMVVPAPTCSFPSLLRETAFPGMKEPMVFSVLKGKMITSETTGYKSHYSHGPTFFMKPLMPRMMAITEITSEDM